MQRSKDAAIFRWLAVTYIPSMVIGGFLFGAAICTECEGNAYARIFIGIGYAILTPLSFGFPPRNDIGYGPPFNAWPYVFPVWCLFALRTGVANNWWRPKNDSGSAHLPE